MSTNDRLAEIEARANAATEGPWGHFHPGQCCQRRCVDSVARHMGGMHNLDGMRPADARFVAHAREDVPALVAALRAVLDEVESHRGRILHAIDTALDGAR